MRSILSNLYFILFFLLSFALANLSYAGGEEYTVVSKGEKKVLVNKRGKVVIPAQYDDLGWTNGSTHLLEDVIGFKVHGLWGILNTKNEKVTESVYKDLVRFDDHWLIASKKVPYNNNVVYGVIDAKGKAAVAFQYYMLSKAGNQLLASKNEDGQFLYGVLDNRGKEVVPLAYEEIKLINDNLFEVRKNGKVGVLDRQGAQITPFELDSLNILSADIILIYKNGKVGLVTGHGEKVVAAKYKNIKLDNGLVKGQKFHEWAAFNAHNNLLATYEYDDMVPEGPDVYKVCVGGAQALLHSSDSLMTTYSNLEIDGQLGDWIHVNKQGKQGVLYADGATLLQPVYDSVTMVHDIFLIKQKVNGKRGWSMYNTKGKKLTNDVYEDIKWLGGNFFSARRQGYWGVLNSLGKEIIFCKYDAIKQYTQGKLLVRFYGEDGILNLDGTWEVLPRKKEIEIVDPIRYLVRSAYGSYVAFYPDTKDFSAEYFLYKRGERYIEKTLDDKFGMRDEQGNRIIKPEYDSISSLQEDSIYYARNEHGYTFITKSGRMLVNDDARFEEIRPMSETFIGVKIDGRWGFVDVNGKLRIANQYDNIGPYHEGLAPIKIRNHWGYIDKNEDIIVQPAYDTVYHFAGGLCEVIKKGKYGLINAAGKNILECEYDGLERLKTGGFLTRLGNKYGLVSNKGRLLLLPRFDHVTDLGNGYVIASRKGRYGLLSADGVNIIPMIYEHLKYNPYDHDYLATKTPEWEAVDIQ